MGLPAVDLLTEEEWTIAKRDFGLVCSTGFPAVRSIPDGINNTKFHDGIVASLDRDDPEGGQGRHPERHHVLRQPPRPGHRGGEGQQRRLPQPASSRSPKPKA